jgi:hypothetical protein
MAIMLDHKYTKSALSRDGVNALKGIDHDRYSLLKSASDNISSKLEFFICHAKMKVDKYDEHYYKAADGYKNGKYIELKKWWDCNGVGTFEGINNTMEDFDLVLNPTTDKQTNGDYLKSEYWDFLRKYDLGYMGNEGMGTTTVYNKCFLVGFSKSMAKYFKFNSLLRCEFGSAMKELWHVAMNNKLLDEPIRL